MVTNVRGCDRPENCIHWGFNSPYEFEEGSPPRHPCNFFNNKPSKGIYYIFTTTNINIRNIIPNNSKVFFHGALYCCVRYSNIEYKMETFMTCY